MEGKIEYVVRQLQDRTETLKSISEESKVSLRTINYLLTSEDAENRGSSLKTINRLYMYFKQKGNP